jgi:CobQ-like glutamine amidotransferase family enzyme
MTDTSTDKKMSENYELAIGWLYPDLMSIYGNRGNIICLQKRCESRGIKTAVKNISLQTSPADLEICDLLFMGGAQDSQQTIVSQDLKEGKSKVLAQMIENGTPGLYICGAYQLLGKYYKEADGRVIDGLEIFDLHTENPGSERKRLIGNVVAELNSELSLDNLNSLRAERGQNTIVGFENHGGRTYLGEKLRPLGKIIKGFGNNGEDYTEGAIYKNSIGSYFHGPILPKNPRLADFLIEKALEKKYDCAVSLSGLDDNLSYKAHDNILKQLGYSANL